MSEITAAWPDWELAELIGTGGWSRVYRARRRDQAEIQAAVKVLRVPLDEAEGVLDEIRQMKRLEGMSHIVSIEDYAVLPESGDTRVLLIRMELLTPLRSYLSDRTFPEEEVLRMGIALCDALSVCHRNGILHGDIKPDNILVRDTLSSGVLFKLGDFGIARLLDREEPEEEADPDALPARGTPEYMAPEQLEGLQDERSDLYSLGVTMYRYLNGGRLPFVSPYLRVPSHEDRLNALKVRLSGTPLPPASGASPETMAILRRACAWRPEERYPTADAFRRALEERLEAPAALRPEGSRQVRPAAGDRSYGKAKERKLPALRLAALLLLLAGVLACAFFLFRPAEEDGPAPAETPLPLQEVSILGSDRIPGGLSALWNAWNAGLRNKLPETLAELPFVLEAGEYAPSVRLEEAEDRVRIRIDPDWSSWGVTIDSSRLRNPACHRSDAEQCWFFRAEPDWQNSTVNLSRESGQAVLQYEFRCADGQLSWIVLRIVPGGRSARLSITRPIAAAEDPAPWTLTTTTETGVHLSGQYAENGERIR